MDAAHQMFDIKRWCRRHLLRLNNLWLNTLNGKWSARDRADAWSKRSHMENTLSARAMAKLMIGRSTRNRLTRVGAIFCHQVQSSLRPPPQRSSISLWTVNCVAPSGSIFVWRRFAHAIWRRIARFQFANKPESWSRLYWLNEKRRHGGKSIYWDGKLPNWRIELNRMWWVHEEVTSLANFISGKKKKKNRRNPEPKWPADVAANRSIDRSVRSFYIVYKTL